MNLDSMEFIQEMIGQKKNKGWDAYNKSWWMCRCWYTLDCFVCSKYWNFGSFGVEHVPEVLDKFFGHKSIKTNIFRIQSNNSIMCGYFCIGFIDFMLAGKTLIDFTSLLSPYDLKKISKLNSIETLISQTLI